MDFHVPLNGVDEGEHFVQFYDEPERLYEGLSRYVFDALGRDGRALLVLTAEHARGIRSILAGRGLNVERVEASGTLAILDADDLLPKLLVDGKVDEDAFNRFVGEVVRQTRRDTEQSVYVFGELVNLLWQKGDVNGLCWLEELWNALMEQTEITLYCGYRLGERAGTDD